MVNLKLLRKKAGLTQSELADHLGVVRQTVGEIERGKNKPSVKLAQKIADLFGFEWKEFFE